METFIAASLMAIATGSAAGLRPYFTVFFLGAAKMWVPDSAPQIIDDSVQLIPDQLANPWVLTVTGLIALGEFLVDKFQFLDSAWDVLQGVLRPIFGALIGMQLGADAGTGAMITGAVLGGGSAGAVSLGKSTLRAVINLLPEPFSNFLTSVGEDAAAIILLVTAILLPVLALILALGLVALGIWLFVKLRRKYADAKASYAEYRERRRVHGSGPESRTIS